VALVIKKKVGDDIKLQLIFFLGLGPGVIFFFERGNYRGAGFG